LYIDINKITDAFLTAYFLVLKGFLLLHDHFVEFRKGWLYQEKYKLEKSSESLTVISSDNCNEDKEKW